MMISSWLPATFAQTNSLHFYGYQALFSSSSSIFHCHHGCRKSAMSMNAPCLISPLHLLEATLFFHPNSYQLYLPLPSHQSCLLQLRITEQCGLLHNPFFKGGNVLEGGVRRGVRGRWHATHRDDRERKKMKGRRGAVNSFLP